MSVQTSASQEEHNAPGKLKGVRAGSVGDMMAALRLVAMSIHTFELHVNAPLLGEVRNIHRILGPSR